MLMHCLLIYSWPASLTNILEKWIRNFIWSGDIDKRKLVTVAWTNCCKSFSDGGLGIRSIIFLNEASNIKQCWDLVNSQDHWARLLRSKVLRNGRQISYHIFSSLWSGLKGVYEDFKQHSSWLIGNGGNINFWLDNWCGQPLVHSLNIPDWIHPHLKSTVKAFVVNHQWSIPQALQLAFPNLYNIVQNITIPLGEVEDKTVWVLNELGDLSLKCAYDYKSSPSQPVHWGKLIWNISIPPSKSLFFWRVIHNKIPTDDNLITRGQHLPSICNLCLKHSESSHHLMFECSFAYNIWRWLSFTLSVPVISNEPSKVQQKNIHWKSSISSIIVDVAFTGNATLKTASTSMSDFSILKAFNIKVHPPKAPLVKEFLWHPPVFNWIKCNTDGASIGVPAMAACGGIFRNSRSDHLGSFAFNIGEGNAFLAELTGAMLAIEIAASKNWVYLWLESDSRLVVLAFSKPSMVPWRIRNRWMNALLLTKSMRFMATHIYREGNHCADKLANIGLTVQTFTWWDDVHRALSMDF
ncbi:hypothetical protein TSUD_236550, partial [Trifolium subterraneum]